MRVHEFPKVVGYFAETPIFYTSYALNVFAKRECFLFLMNEPDFISFSTDANYPALTVAVFRIKWKGGVK